MSVKQFFKAPIKTICEQLGKSNLPVYTVATVAVFKGILRPTFTMMDKKSDPETKKYAAVKEGATELIAIPTYISLSWITSKLAPAFSPKGKNYDQLLHSSKSTLGFFGVCFAALYAIPKLCNMAMPSVMKILKLDKKKDGAELQVKPFATESVFKTEEMPKGFKNVQIAGQSPYTKTPVGGSGGLRV